MGCLFLWPEWNPPLLFGLPASIHKLVGIEIVLRYFVASPPLHEVVIIECVQAVIIRVVLEHILRHCPDVQIRMVMLQPKIISQDDQFDERRVGIKLKPDGFPNRP